MCTSADRRLEWPGRHYSSRTQINAGSQNKALFESFPRPLLKSGLRPWTDYGTHQETISRRAEQSILHLTQLIGMAWGWGHYSSRTRMNAGGPKCNHCLSQPWAIIKVRPGPLFRYGTHQTINERLEQVYLPSDPRLEWPEEEPLFELDLNKCRGQNVGTIRLTPWAIIYVRPGALGQIRHRCKSLSYVAEYLSQICWK